MSNNILNKLEYIVYNNNIFGIIVRSNYTKKGIEFFTPDNFSQQLAFMRRPKGYVIEPHLHNQIERRIKLTKEVLFIRKGKVRIDFYDDNKEYIESRVLYKGDVILLAQGGHGLEMLEPTEIIEVKQGPYLGDKDKIKFDSVKRKKIIIKERKAYDTCK